jgi:hypothetical protein
VSGWIAAVVFGRRGCGRGYCDGVTALKCDFRYTPKIGHAVIAAQCPKSAPNSDISSQSCSFRQAREPESLGILFDKFGLLVGAEVGH